MRIAVLGTGITGAAMARSLAREGHDVAVWNRTPDRAEGRPVVRPRQRRKDVGLMLDSAHDADFPDDLLAALLAVYDRAAGQGLGGADMAAVRAAFDA